MAESDLAARLKAHEDAFQGLLELIPAKFYNPEDAANQWSRKKQTKEEAAQSRRAKLDPTQNSVKVSTPAVPSKSPSADPPKGKKRKRAESEKNEVPSKAQRKKLNDGGKALKTVEKTSLAHHAADAIETATQTEDSGETNGIALVARPDRSRNIAELRERLAAKIEILRAKRKAPGSAVDGAPKTREAILEARRRKDDTRRERKKLEKQAMKDAALELPATDVIEDAEVDMHMSDDEGDDTKETNVDYGRVHTGQGERLKHNGTLQAPRARKQQDTNSALQAALNKKERLAVLPEDKREKIAQSDTWHKALLQADGEKVKDDLGLLKKAAKRKEGVKKKSEKEWKERLSSIAKAKALKQKNREQNLKDRRESKGKAGGHKKGKQIGAFQGKAKNKRQKSNKGF